MLEADEVEGASCFLIVFSFDSHVDEDWFSCKIAAFEFELISSYDEDEDVDEEVRQLTNGFVVDRKICDLNGLLAAVLVADDEDDDEELTVDEIDEFLPFNKSLRFENFGFLLLADFAADPNIITS